MMKKMTEEQFQICLEHWKESVGNQPFWGELAVAFGYPSVDSIRSAFKRERQARGIEKSGMRTAQQEPVVGVVDLETLPMKLEAYTFGLRDQYLTYDMVAKDSRMLSWAGKILGDPRVFSDVLTPNEALEYDSYRITESARAFVASCDYVIGHNWEGFDRKVLNTELLFWRVKPVRYRTIDTYLLIRSHFQLPSYKLADVNKMFGIRNKVSHEGFNLWKRCAAGEQSALNEMLYYNEGDILATEELYERISPYVSDSLPNFNIHFEDVKNYCNSCSGRLHKDSEKPFWHTNSAKFERLVCAKCGAIYHGRKNVLSKEKRAVLLKGM